MPGAAPSPFTSTRPAPGCSWDRVAGRDNVVIGRVCTIQSEASAAKHHSMSCGEP